MNELDPEARRMLSLAHAARTPTAADKARVERRLAAVLGASAAAATASALGTAQAATQIKTVGAFAALKWWIGGGALLATVASGYVALNSQHAPAAVTPVVPPQPSAAAVSAPVATPERVAPPAANEPSVTNHKPTQSPRRDQGQDLVRELELLHTAQAAWRGAEPARALAIVEQHQRRYPHSELAQEREALHVLILCELGRAPEAQRRARKLLDRAPQLPLRAAIEESCAVRPALAPTK